MATVTPRQGERAGAEITYGPEQCYRQSLELLKELGFPSGVMPLPNLEECGIVKETGFIWMKQKKPYEHFFETTNSRVVYATEVTAYVEKFRMKKMTGVKTKQLLWVPIAEMSIDDPKGRKICFKTPVGIGKSYPVTAFMGEEEKIKYLEKPGLTGGSQDSYVRHMLIRARDHGWRGLVFNSRGCGNSPVTTPQFYSASFLGDMREVVAHVTTRYPKANVYAVGWSLGGNILVNYLGQDSLSCPLSGAVSLCNPFDLLVSDEDFRKGFNNVYDKALAGTLRRFFNKHADLFNDIPGEYNLHVAANARTVREYDDALTRVSFGFNTVDEYYSKSSSSKFIKDVKIPLLCIQAENDPIAPDRAIPRQDIKENPNCLLIVTPKGGHLGWVAGPGAPLGAPWTDRFVIDFLVHLESQASKASADLTTAEMAA